MVEEWWKARRKKTFEDLWGVSMQLVIWILISIGLLVLVSLATGR